VPHNLPRSGVAKFVGRETELNTLHEKLQQSGRLNIAAIKGMGGIGKSELALQYAYRHRKLGSYPGGLCWLDLRSGDLGGQLVRFARLHLGLTFPDNMPLSDQVTLCWQQWTTGEVLLVYDNAGEYGEMQSFLPPADPRFRVLITSRNRMGLPVETIEIVVLDESASLELLGVLAGKDRVQSQLGEGDAKKLCRWLGYLPLAIELVGRYLAKKPDLSLSVMIERLEKNRLSAKALVETEAGMTSELGGVVAAFELSWQELDEKGQELGCLLSLFAEAPIPWELVEDCLSEWKSEELEDKRDVQLCGLSLLERPEEGKYQLHPLIREYFVGKLKLLPDREVLLKREYCNKIILHLNKNRLNYKEIGKLQTNIMQALKYTIDLEIKNLYAEGVNNFFLYLLDRGLLDYAEEHLKRICEIDSISPENLAKTYMNLGTCAVHKTKYPEAHKFYRDSLHYTEITTNNVLIIELKKCFGTLEFKQGEYQKSEEYFTGGLALARESEDTTRIFQMLVELAKIQDIQGQHEAAEESYKEAISIGESMEKESGQEADSSKELFCELHTGIGWVMAHKGDYVNAENYWQNGLDCATDIDKSRAIVYLKLNLGWLADRKGNNLLAMRYFSDVENGSPDPEMRATLLINRGAAFLHQGKYSEARSDFEESLIDAAYGGHQMINIVQENLGILSMRCNDYNTANKFLTKALKTVTSEEYPERASAILTYLAELKCYEAELKCYENDIEQSKKYLEESTNYLIRGLKIALEIKNMERIAVARKTFGRLYILEGRIENAQDSLNEALISSRKLGYKCLTASILILLADRRLASLPEDAIAKLNGALCIAEKIKGQELEAEAHYGLSMLKLEVGKREEAESHAKKGLTACGGSEFKVYKQLKDLAIRLAL
jgi:Tfp pilus assembly protein PilF